jgi:hypothetical protein
MYQQTHSPFLGRCPLPTHISLLTQTAGHLWGAASAPMTMTDTTQSHPTQASLTTPTTLPSWCNAPTSRPRPRLQASAASALHLRASTAVRALQHLHLPPPQLPSWLPTTHPLCSTPVEATASVCGVLRTTSQCRWMPPQHRLALPALHGERSVTQGHKGVG